MKSELINQIYADVSQSEEYQKSEEMKQLTKIHFNSHAPWGA